MVRQLILALALFIITPNLFAQEDTKKDRFRVYKENSGQRAVIRNRKNLSVYYEKTSWNQDPLKIESGYLYLRDRKTGKLTELKLSETEPNSSVFNIDFPSGALEQSKIEAEIYSAPQEMLSGKNRLSVMQKLIDDKAVRRKPFLLRVLRRRGQIVDIFDSKTAALAAYNKYKKQMGLDPEGLESDSIVEVANQDKPTQKKIIDTSTLQSLFMANENNLTATVEKNRELREVLKNMEIKRRASVQEKANGWGPSKTKSNKVKAASNIKKAVKDINSQNFKASMEKFLKASDLAPKNEDIYQQYGISLFRHEKFNQAIVILELSKPSKKRQAEKNFYRGMSYFQIEDYEAAIAAFNEAMQPEDNPFAATAAYYKGSALLELQRFEESKKAFQFVLDKSNDPKLDDRAEKSIEYAINRESLEKKRSNWYFFDGTIGLIYDSNIVLAQDRARQLDQEGWRFLTQLSTRLRPYYSEKDEVSVRIDLTNLKSFDQGFGSNPTAEQADPTIIALGVPWTHRGTLGGKGYFFELSPGYENIIMDLDGNGATTIQESIRADFKNTLVINNEWIAKGDWFLSSNDSTILGTDVSGISGGLMLSSIFIMNKDLERYLIPEFGYQINESKSDDYAFSRVDLGLTFTTAIFDSWMWNSKFAFYLSNFESNRTDNNYSVTTGVSTRLGAHWTWGLTGAYIVNDSTTNPYNKYNLISTFSFSY